MAQAFLHGRQDLGILPRLDIDDPVGPEPDAGERGSEEIASLEAPQDGAAGAGQDAGDEQRRDRDMLARLPVLHDLVEAAERQPAPWQVAVDRLDPEGERRPARPCRTLESQDPSTQIGQNGIVPGIRHALPKRFGGDVVPILFSRP